MYRQLPSSSLMIGTVSGSAARLALAFGAVQLAGIDVKRTMRIELWMSPSGGQRAYMGRLGKDRSVRQGRHSIAGANRASPPEAGVPNANHGYDAKLSSPKTGRAAGFWICYCSAT